MKKHKVQFVQRLQKKPKGKLTVADLDKAVNAMGPRPRIMYLPIGQEAMIDWVNLMAKGKQMSYCSRCGYWSHKKCRNHRNNNVLTGYIVKANHKTKTITLSA